MANSRYSEGKIYKINLARGGNGPCYVGSTCTKYLAARLREHQGHFKQWKAGKYHFVTSYKLIEQGEVEITLIEPFPTRSLDELKARERYWIERLDCVNRCIPGRTDAEWYADHREERKAQCRKYDELNRDERNAKAREYRKQHREQINTKKREKVGCPTCGLELSRDCLWRHKKRKHSDSSSSTEPAAIFVEVASSSASTEAPPN